MIASGVLSLLPALSGGFAHADGRNFAIAVFATIFFAACTLAYGVMLFPQAASLEFDKTGFGITNLFITRRFRWGEVGEFSVGGSYGVSWVTFRIKTIEATTSLHYSFLKRMAGRRMILVRPYYHISTGDMLKVLVAWRSQAIQSLPPDAITFVSREAPRNIKARTKIAVKETVSQLGSLSWAGLLLIGGVLVIAIVGVLLSIHQPHFLQLGPPPDPILANHGPQRVACDSKWQQRDATNAISNYRTFLSRCMRDAP